MAPSFERLITGEFSSPLQYEFWPADERNSRKTLIVLHGRGDSSEGFHWLPEALNLPEFNYLFLNAPDRSGIGFSWYEMAPRQGPGVTRSRRMLMDLLGRLQKEIGLSTQDIFLFGFSQGCLLTLDLALRYPKVFGGVVSLSGYVFFMEEYPQMLSPVVGSQHIFMTHGHDDEVLPLTVTRASVMALRHQGVHIDWREYDKAHTIDVHTELPQIRAFLKHLLELC